MKTATPADHTAATIAATKKGEYIRLIANGPVYLRGDYDRTTKRYSLTRADDINAERLVIGSKACFIGFTY